MSHRMLIAIACMLAAVSLEGCGRPMVDITIGPLAKGKGAQSLAVAVVEFDFKPEARDTTSHGSVTRPQNAGALIADMLSNKLLAQGMKVIERTRLQQVLDEQRLSHADLLSDQHRVRVGRLLNANVIVVGTLSEYATAHGVGGFSGWVSFAARGVDVETGEVLFGIVASDDRTYMDGHGVAALLMQDVGTRLERELTK